MSARDISYSLCAYTYDMCDVSLEFKELIDGVDGRGIERFYILTLGFSPHAYLKAGRENAARNLTALAPIIESAKGHGLDPLLGDGFYDHLARRIYCKGETREFCIGTVNLKDRYWVLTRKPNLKIMALLITLGDSNCFQQEFTSMYKRFYDSISNKMLAGDRYYEAAKDKDAVELCKQMLSDATALIARTNNSVFSRLSWDLSEEQHKKLTDATTGIQNICTLYKVTGPDFDAYTDALRSNDLKTSDKLSKFKPGALSGNPASTVASIASALGTTLSNTGLGSGSGAGAGSEAPRV